LFNRYYEGRSGVDWLAFEFDRPARAAYLVSDGMRTIIKRSVWILVLALGASLTVSGCGHKGVSTSELQSSFKSAEPAMQTLVDKAVASVNSNNYPEALNDLQTLSHKARLTVDQEQALKDTIAAIEEKTSGLTNKPAAEPPSKLPSELQKLFGKPQ
jgi:hypothetical protein